MNENKSDRLFWLTTKVRPHFNCPWGGEACPDKLGCVSKDSCWRFEQDKKDALAEDPCPDCGRDMNSLGMYRDYIHYKPNSKDACLPND